MPWQDALCVDVRYRGGYTFHGREVEEVADSPERHQWLEFTVRPSCKSFICDLYLEDGPGGGQGRLLGAPIDDAYSTIMYPNGILPVFCEHRVALRSVGPSDFATGGAGK